MNGRVDRAGRSLVDVNLRATASAKSSPIVAWVDTAFTGELVVPSATIERLGLQQSSAVMAGLANGKEVVLETFSCLIEWFGEERQIEVIESDAQYALLGTSLLRDRKLEIDFRLRTLVIT